MTMTDLANTPRSRVKRMPTRGRYDFDTVAAILDAGFLCHVGYVIDGKPYVTPTSYWREGDHVYWHGSSASRALRALEGGVQACLTVSLIDGLVLARSAFHHSINYRSVMLFGGAHKVEDPAQKERALENFVERMYPGRWKTLRPATAQEIKATTVLHMKIEEGAAKVRTGPPVDDDEDYGWPAWAGVVPVRTVIGAAQDDGRVVAGVERPEYLGKLQHLGLASR
jgi:nitroimidazol reductase NimA-like FMN-containing flavoprotein (pyridoxamine 5'-phosphate oxidase superfamily)